MKAAAVGELQDAPKNRSLDLDSCSMNINKIPFFVGTEWIWNSRAVQGLASTASITFSRSKISFNPIRAGGEGGGQFDPPP